MAVGSHIDRQLSVNGEYWLKVAVDRFILSQVTKLIVFYNVPPENDAKQMHVWCVVAGASNIVK